jgi:hypothetical protein
MRRLLLALVFTGAKIDNTHPQNKRERERENSQIDLFNHIDQTLQLTKCVSLCRVLSLFFFFNVIILKGISKGGAIQVYQLISQMRGFGSN